MAIRIRDIAIAGYRSLRSIRFPVGQLTVFVGANGVGKAIGANHRARGAADPNLDFTHSERLADAFAASGGVTLRTVIKRDGGTWIEGLKLFGEFGADDGEDG